MGITGTYGEAGAITTFVQPNGTSFQFVLDTGYIGTSGERTIGPEAGNVAGIPTLPGVVFLAPGDTIQTHNADTTNAATVYFEVFQTPL